MCDVDFYLDLHLHQHSSGGAGGGRRKRLKGDPKHLSPWWLGCIFKQFCCLPPLICCCCPRPPRPQTPPYLGALSASALSADGSADLCFFRLETISQPAFNSRLTVMVLTFWTVREGFPNPTPAFPSSYLLLLRAPACLNGSFKNSRLNSFKVSF